MKVMKSFVLAAAAVAVAMGAQAELAIDWSNPNGYYDSNDVDGAALVTGGGIYAALVWDEDGTPGAAATGDLFGGGTALVEVDLAALAGNDFGWGTIIPVGGDGSVPFQGGFVYARVFEASDAGSVDVGTWYYDGPVIEVVDVNKGNTPPDLSQAYNANRDSSSNGFGGDPLSTAQVVPEPTTLALLVVGLGTMLFRRRR